MQRKVAPRPAALVPFSASGGGVPRFNVKWYRSPLRTGCTYASLPSLLERIKDEASGTSTWENAGLGLLTVRAQSQAMTVSFLPTSGLRSGRSFAISAVISTGG